MFHSSNVFVRANAPVKDIREDILRHDNLVISLISQYRSAGFATAGADNIVSDTPLACAPSLGTLTTRVPSVKLIRFAELDIFIGKLMLGL